MQSNKLEKASQHRAAVHALEMALRSMKHACTQSIHTYEFHTIFD